MLKAEEQLVELQKLMMNNEEEKADNLRDEMSDHWSSMSEQDQEMLQHMSGDLYVLEGKEFVYLFGKLGISSHDFAPMLHKKLEAQDWDGALSLLRFREPSFSSYRTSLIRCWCYLCLGFVRAPYLFYEHAETLGNNGITGVGVLQTPSTQQ